MKAGLYETVTFVLFMFYYVLVLFDVKFYIIKILNFSNLRNYAIHAMSRNK